MPTSTPASAAPIPPFWHRLRAISLYPLRDAALFTIIALTLTSLLTVLPGIGWIIGVLVWLGAYKYAFEILRVSADGRDEPPEVITSADNGTVLRFLALQVLFIGVLLGTLMLLGPGAALVAALLLALAQPGATISLAMDGSLPHAANPATWVAIMGRIGWPYFAVVALLFVFQASAANAEALMARFLPPFVDGLVAQAISLWGLFATFRLMGYLVLQYHEPLGYVPEHLAGEQARTGPDQGLLEQAAALVQAGETETARTLLAEEIRTRAVSPGVHELYRKLLRLEGDRAALDAHARTYLNLLMVEGDERRALELVREALVHDRDFAPLQVEHGETLVAAADRRGDSQLALDLRLAMWRAHPRAAAAAAWATGAARLLVDKFGREQEALALLDASQTALAAEDTALHEERERLRALIAALATPVPAR